ncbi:CYTH domain-containing protein [Aliidiomarina indica]|uniref:CYTH domain-containing protein n=1 Tax=Aliidiomarina indica TaxID=2749147 RepID=UPI00188ED49C
MTRDQEVELKFLIDSKEIQALQEYLDVRAKRLEPLHLQNIYFDTPDEILSEERIGLRIRRWNDQCEQTIKLAGIQQGAMSQRPEYNQPCDSDRPDLTKFPAEIFDEHLDPKALTERLEPMFHVNFLRHRWLCESEGTAIEVALDKGHILSGDLQEEILELELELVSGDVSEIERMVSDLEQSVVLSPGTHSKAQRGFALRAKAQRGRGC